MVGGSGDAALLGCGSGGYTFAINSAGTLFLGRVGIDSVYASAGVTDTSFHHVAVTKVGTNVVFYIDGVAYPAPPYSTMYTFTTAIAIGARGDDLSSSFLGTIDELSVYSRALAASEIQSIYAARTLGKCFVGVPPMITSQPANQSVLAGGNASFAVTATGTAPFGYQWSFNGVNINGATNAILTLVNVQLSQMGNYAATVFNSFGAALSSNAVLTVNPPLPCVPPPAGILSWWRGEGNALDSAGTNIGTLTGNATYGPGMVGQGFVLNGYGEAVQLGNPASLQLQDFTIEGWMSRGSTSVVGGSGDAALVDAGGVDRRFALNSAGTLFLGRVGIDAVYASAGVTDTSFHHVAVTKVGTNVVFYIDGVAYPAPPYSTTYTFATAIAIGARGDDLSSSFLGTIDELSVYSRALTTSEIQSIYVIGSGGKCTSPFPPIITSEPTNQTVLVGGTASFSVAATGAAPLSYQWKSNGVSISGATNTVLTLTNVQLSQAGNYAVVVSNVYGGTLSSNAVLTVNPILLCAPVPVGLVGWWRAEGNALDSAGTNNGTLAGNTDVWSRDGGRGICV